MCMCMYHKFNNDVVKSPRKSRDEKVYIPQKTEGVIVHPCPNLRQNMIGKGVPYRNTIAIIGSGWIASGTRLLNITKSV